MSDQPQMIYLSDYKPCDFVVDNVHLNFELQEKTTRVISILHLSRNPQSDRTDAPLVLQGEELDLVRVAMDGKALADDAYQVDATSLTIANVANECVIEIEVTITPHDNTTLMGLFKSRNNYCTQCEPNGFRRITYFFDRPDVMTKFTTTITADKKQYPYLLSNGNLIEQRDLEGGRHWVHWEDPSLKPCYLFALVAGDFDLLEDTMTTMSGRDVKLELFVEKGFGHQGDYALTSLKNAMIWDETRWGREYDLDIYMIVAVSDFNMGAMENKGLNIFNTKYVLAQSETATDMDYKLIETVIGHEYFHNWSGNRVTCRDWFQITLKEGLTVFRDQEFTADMTSRAVSRLDVVSVVRNAQFVEDSGPLAHAIRPDAYIEINNFYTTTVYRKGSEVIRMVQTLITPEVFRKGLDLYFHRYDGQAVTTEEFITSMEEASGQDLTQFRRWYEQSGTPLLTVTSDYDADKKLFSLTVKQSCPATPGQDAKKPFYLPFSVALVGAGKQETRVLVVSQEEQTFTFDAVEKEPLPSLLRDFSAPVKMRYDYSDEALALLVEHDENPFARWNAAQELATRYILALSDDIANGNALKKPILLIDAFSMLLDNEMDDLDYLSRLLQLPSENYLHQQRDSVDVHAISKARNYCYKTLATELHDQWQACYEKYNDPDVAYQYDVTAVAQRSFKNTCLSYLVTSGIEVERQRAFDQFKKANNMTDRLAALAALNHVDCTERTDALTRFYEQWSDDPLVVNKWLTIQAASTVPNTFERVLELMQHEAFDLKNPNNVYALLSTFGANATEFHAENGEGYRLIADQVLYLNKRNPQVAARLLQPLTQWRRYGVPYRDLMREQLERIAVQRSALSTDIYEIVTKSLV
ncbi:MAG: aminopeptidase N [Coxiella sp. (in: Bacteria)]|nr:MAG: aminopeptidase N [Coxiella sp. (in: g-proteobacteria)]